MRAFATAALAVGVILAAPAYDGATPIYKHRVHAHHAYRSIQTEKIERGSTPAPGFFLRIAPYQPGQGDTVGLSRNPDDCNKGCIGGNPG
jgi:hypothetical protein